MNDVGKDSTLVWTEVMTEAMTALPSRRAQLNTAPTVPATAGGVAAKMAMLGQGLRRRDKLGCPAHFMVANTRVVPIVPNTNPGNVMDQ